MKAISVRQPWAWALLHGKDVENRSRNIVGGHRGPVLLHAGQHLADAAAFARVQEITGAPMPPLGGPGARTELHAESAIVGAVDVIGVHIRVADPVILHRPVPCPGRLGFFTPSDLVLAEVRRQLR